MDNLITSLKMIHIKEPDPSRGEVIAKTSYHPVRYVYDSSSKSSMLYDEDNINFIEEVSFKIRGYKVKNGEPVFDELSLIIAEGKTKEDILKNIYLEFYVDPIDGLECEFNNTDIDDPSLIFTKTIFATKKIGKNVLKRILETFSISNFNKENILEILVDNSNSISNTVFNIMLSFYKQKFNLSEEEVVSLKLLREIGGYHE